MNQDIANHAFEQINNQILRLLLYFGGAVILALSAALSYLWISWRSEQKERIAVDKANAEALTSVAFKLEKFEDTLQRLTDKIKLP